MIGAAAVAQTSTNPAGATVSHLSTETWSGSTQTNPAGATVQLAGASDESVDTDNPAGAFAYIGHFDPLAQAGISQGWLMR
jgi:hypothetical protein